MHRAQFLQETGEVLSGIALASMLAQETSQVNTGGRRQAAHLPCWCLTLVLEKSVVLLLVLPEMQDTCSHKRFPSFMVPRFRMSSVGNIPQQTTVGHGITANLQTSKKSANLCDFAAPVLVEVVQLGFQRPVLPDASR